MKNKNLHLPKLKLIPNSIINLPGSKSITNRCLLLAAISKGRCKLNNTLCSDDTVYMKKALIQLGINIIEDNNSIIIDGCNLHFKKKEENLFLGNAGTAVRSLTALLALFDGKYKITGIKRMHQRPIADLVNSLKSIGAKIDYIENKGYPPIIIHPFNDNYKENITINGNISSQFLTSMLLTLPTLKRKITIFVENGLISKPYVDISLKLLNAFNINITNNNYKSFDIHKDNKYISPKNFFIEGDASNASYYLAASFITGIKLKIYGIGINSIQGDIKFIKILENLGAKIKWFKNHITIHKDPKLKIQGFNIDAIDIPDAAMTLAIIALTANGNSKIYNISSWKIKETDRIEAMKTELQKLGAIVKSTNNSIKITPPLKLKENINIDTYDDHRIAMCFSLISLLNTSITINDYKCVNKTYPKYFEDFLKITNYTSIILK